ncbi:MAG: hypothetical protein J0H43_06375, partial [Actinobacteria bacterium]|nr:hypothetical protein [Actinomycetota bacterium]
MSRFTLRRTLPVAGAAVVAAAAMLALALPGTADAHRAGPAPAVPAPPAAPTSADQIQNLDQVRTAIEAYYGDTPTTTPDPVNGATTLHTFSPTGAYAKEMGGIVTNAERYLDRAARPRGHHSSATKAILLDVDDTTLNTYNYEIYSNFVYNPTTNAAFVNSGAFPAVPHMVDLVDYARAKGYAIFFLTGRPGTQRAGTVANLASVGYPSVAPDHLYLKDYTADTWLSSCAPSCTTTQKTAPTPHNTTKPIRGAKVTYNYTAKDKDCIERAMYFES